MLFEALDELDREGDLLVLDRGYVGNAPVAWLGQGGFRFCMRVEATGWGCVKTFLRSGLPEQRVTLKVPTRADCTTYEIERRPCWPRHSQPSTVPAVASSPVATIPDSHDQNHTSIWPIRPRHDKQLSSERWVWSARRSASERDRQPIRPSSVVRP